MVTVQEAAAASRRPHGFDFDLEAFWKKWEAGYAASLLAFAVRAATTSSRWQCRLLLRTDRLGGE